VVEGVGVARRLEGRHRAARVAAAAGRRRAGAGVEAGGQPGGRPGWREKEKRGGKKTRGELCFFLVLFSSVHHPITPVCPTCIAAHAGARGRGGVGER